MTWIKFTINWVNKILFSGRSPMTCWSKYGHFQLLKATVSWLKMQTFGFKMTVQIPVSFICKLLYCLSCYKLPFFVVGMTYWFKEKKCRFILNMIYYGNFIVIKRAKCVLVLVKNTIILSHNTMSVLCNNVKSHEFMELWFSLWSGGSCCFLNTQFHFCFFFNRCSDCETQWHESNCHMNLYNKSLHPSSFIDQLLISCVFWSVPFTRYKHWHVSVILLLLLFLQ